MSLALLSVRQADPPCAGPWGHSALVAEMPPMNYIHLQTALVMGKFMALGRRRCTHQNKTRASPPQDPIAALEYSNNVIHPFSGVVTLE